MCVPQTLFWHHHHHHCSHAFWQGFITQLGASLVHREAMTGLLGPCLDRRVPRICCLQAPPTPKQPEGVSQEHRSQVEEETLKRLLPLLYFSQVHPAVKRPCNCNWVSAALTTLRGLQLSLFPLVHETSKKSLQWQLGLCCSYRSQASLRLYLGLCCFHKLTSANAVPCCLCRPDCQ